MDHAELLEEIRDNFDRDVKYYEDIRKEGETDMRFLSGDPWDPHEKQLRENAKRPMVSEDQLNQYCNQVVNEALVSKRDVQVDAGDNSDPEAVRFTADMMRQINFDSDGDDCHHTAFENAVQRSYGVWGLLTEYENPRSFESEKKIILRRFQNPNSVIWDPDCKLADFSDMGHAYVIDRISKKAFNKKYPNKDRAPGFFAESIQLAPAWFRENDIQLAEYWRREMKQKVLLGVMEGQQLTRVYLDELIDGTRLDKQAGMLLFPGGQRTPIARDDQGAPLIRMSEEPQVTQYLTNGVEILDEIPWDGSWIPLFPVIGKEMWVDAGGGPKRVWLSLIRLARDPQTRLNYFRTTEVEAVGQVPKTKWMMYEGQIEGHEKEWETANRNPVTALQVKPLLDATGINVLPLPKEIQFAPPIIPMEAGAESAARAIQSAIGAFNTSIGNTDVNVKSGVAIKQLQAQTQIGAFHFRASLERALRNQGRQEDQLIQKLYSGRRTAAVRTAKGEQRTVTVNDPNFVNPDTQQQQHIQVGPENTNRVTIGVGPSYKSEMERASEIIDKLIHQSPEEFSKGADIWIRTMGLPKHIEDELVERYAPPGYAPTKDGQPAVAPEVQKKIANYEQMIDALTEQVKLLTQQRDNKQMDNDVKMQIAQLNAEVEKLKSDQATFLGLEKISSDENLAVAEQRLSIQMESDRAQVDAAAAEKAAAAKPQPQQ